MTAKSKGGDRVIISRPMKGRLDKQNVKKLYTTAFPREEQLPWWVLCLQVRLRKAELTCYERDGIFCGFTLTSSTAQVQFVMFFAVEADLRGKGYGTGILELLKVQNPQRPIILNVEPLDDEADNAAQRVSRMRFYEKNGFYDTGYEIDEVGGTFRILSTRQRLDVEAYLTMFQRMSFGLWRPEIREVQK